MVKPCDHPVGGVLTVLLELISCLIFLPQGSIFPLLYQKNKQQKHTIFLCKLCNAKVCLTRVTQAPPESEKIV